MCMPRILPKWRGAAPINWAIVNGDPTTGVCIITLAEKMDAGDILGALETPIEPGETAGALHDRLAELSAPVLLETIDKIQQGKVERIAQDHSQATLAKKLKKADGAIDFTQPAKVIERRVRGFWPLARCQCRLCQHGIGQVDPRHPGRGRDRCTESNRT